MIERQLLIRPLMTEEEAARWATSEELAHVRTFGTEQRRREYLTWRAVVRETLNAMVSIAYDEEGAPRLVGRVEQISVSHAGDRVAVAISDRRTGIDIERTDRRFDRVKAKYLTLQEQQISADPLYLAAAWCAKEAIYKWAGIRELSFEEVQIVAFDGRHLTATVRGGAPVTLSITCPDEGYVMATI